MMGESHGRFGVTSWFITAGVLTLAPAYTDMPMPPLDAWEVVYGGIMAGAVSQGWLSPDADQHPWLGKVIPGGHRGPSHMPDLVLALWVGLLWLSWDSPARGMSLAIAVGHLSHIASDALFGKVPVLLLAGKRVGLTLDTDGWVERWIVRRLLLPAAALLGVAAGWLSLDLPLPDSATVADVVGQAWR